MLPVRICLPSPYSGLKSEYTTVRWITTFLFVAAVAIPCTFFFRATTPSASFLLSVPADLRPRPLYIPAKTTWGAATAAATRNTRSNAEPNQSTSISTSSLPRAKAGDSSSLRQAGDSSSLRQAGDSSSLRQAGDSSSLRQAGDSSSLRQAKSETSKDVPAKSEKAKGVSAKSEKAKGVSAKSVKAKGVSAKPKISIKPPPAKPLTRSALSFGELENEDLRLEKVLKAAAMENNTVIITTSNAAWSAPGSIMDLFLESFHNGNGTEGLLKHVVIVALDPEAYARCKVVHPYCFALSTEGVDFSAEKEYMSDGYLLLVWRKLDILRMVLRKGYDFIFTDADVMWFRNPLSEFFPEADFQSSCDKYVGDPSSLENEPNTGFKYVKANNRTIAFYDFWYESRLKYPGQGQQVVFNGIKLDPYIQQIGISIRFLSDQVFGGLCLPPKQISGVCTMHSTCCIGLQSKVHDLEILSSDWKRYTSLPAPFREERRYRWSELQFNCMGVPSYEEKKSPSPTSQPHPPRGRIGVADAPNITKVVV